MMTITNEKLLSQTVSLTGTSETIVVNVNRLTINQDKQVEYSEGSFVKKSTGMQVGSFSLNMNDTTYQMRDNTETQACAAALNELIDLVTSKYGDTPLSETI